MILKLLIKKLPIIFIKESIESKMIAFSRVPPSLQQTHEVTFQEIPFQKIIEVEAIQQPKRQTKQISNHLISNPNQIGDKKYPISQKDIIATVEKTPQQNAGKDGSVSEDRIVQRVQITEKVVVEKQKTEFSLFACKQVEIEQGQQLILPDRSPIKILYQRQLQEGKPSLQSAQQNQINEQQFSEHTHIVFASPVENANTQFYIKKPIFTKDLSRDVPAAKSNPQQNLAESIVKEHQVNLKIVQNLDSFVNPNQSHIDSHIQCTLFGNSGAQPYQSSSHRTGYELFNSLQKNNKNQGQIRRPHSIFDKAERQTTDKELYESYHRNKNKPKQLGGSKKLIETKNPNKISLKALKLQLTKLVNISPRVF